MVANDFSSLERGRTKDKEMFFFSFQPAMPAVPFLQWPRAKKLQSLSNSKPFSLPKQRLTGSKKNGGMKMDEDQPQKLFIKKSNVIKTTQKR